MDWLSFWIAALATYRITVMISRDRGPFEIFSRSRKDNKLLDCPFCVSPYVGSIVAVAFWAFGIWAAWFFLPFALSGVTIALDRIFTADYKQK